MTKNNLNDQSSQPIKPMVEMDDIEFITYADYLSSPYYRAYIDAKCRAKGQVNDWAKSSEFRYDQNASVPEDKLQEKNKDKGANNKSRGIKASKLYEKKRGVALIIVALFMLVVILAAALGVVNVLNIDSYVAAYIEPGAQIEDNINISIIDPILGTIKDLAKVNLDSNFYKSYLADNTADANIMTKIALYAVPAAALLIIVFAFIGLIKAVVALFSKKTLSGQVKKYGFGFISIVMFLCALIMAAGGIYVAQIELTKALDYLTQKSTVLNVGYGMYALLAIPVITFVCSCCAYKKSK